MIRSHAVIQLDQLQYIDSMRREDGQRRGKCWTEEEEEEAGNEMRGKMKKSGANQFRG